MVAKKKAKLFKKSPYGFRRKVKKCTDCGIGTVYEYEAVGFLNQSKKCDLCGSSDEN